MDSVQNNSVKKSSTFKLILISIATTFNELVCKRKSGFVTALIFGFFCILALTQIGIILGLVVLLGISPILFKILVAALQYMYSKSDISTCFNHDGECQNASPILVLLLILINLIGITYVFRKCVRTYSIMAKKMY